MEDVDLASQSHRRDPHEGYATARRRARAHWDDVTGAWYVGRFEDVDALVRDDRLGSYHHPPRRGDAADEVSPTTRQVEDFFTRWPLYDHSERHAVIRTALMTTLGPAATRDLKPEVARWTGDLVANSDPHDTDLVVDLARPLAVKCLRALLGIGADEVDELMAWNSRWIDYVMADADEQTASRALDGVVHLDRFVADVLVPRASGLAIRPLVPLVDAGRIEHRDVVGVLAELAFATVEPTTSLIARAIHELARDSAARAALSTGRISPVEITEEALRFDPSFHFANRVASEPLTIGGASIGEGQRVNLVLASANRDEERWSAPDVFDPSRPVRRHLAFARGRHSCLGAWVARAQTHAAIAAVATDAWLDAFAGQPLERLPMMGVTEFRQRRLRRRPAATEA